MDTDQTKNPAATTDKKWWLITFAGNPEEVLTPGLRTNYLPIALIYTGRKRYYELYYYGTYLNMMRLCYTIGEATVGKDIKIVGEQQVPYSYICENETLRLLFSSTITKLANQS